jgi:3-dehydroshikimate dehydratase
MKTNSTILPGLVSITFRQLSPEEVLALVVQAELGGIEWGGDVHVPHGEVDTARAIGEATRARGIEVAAYGSYYHAGSDEGPDFTDVLETAVALGAPTIRVWAGTKGSANISPDERIRVYKDLRRIAALAAKRALSVSIESHSNTLTDTIQSAETLYDDFPDPNLYAYWQTRLEDSVEESLSAIAALLPRLMHIHVFHWTPGYERYPLAAGEASWMRYLRAIARDGARRFALLEFVQDDEPENFLQDAHTLRDWLENL